MKIKTSTLTGEKLAYWTASIQGWRIVNPTGDRPCWFTRLPSGEVKSVAVKNYRPDINAGQAMELVKVFDLSIVLGVSVRHPKFDDVLINSGTLEQNICRAVVASVFGDEVDDE